MKVFRANRHRTEISDEERGSLNPMNLVPTLRIHVAFVAIVGHPAASPDARLAILHVNQPSQNNTK